MGTKLAGATIVLLLVASIAGYIGLSRYQRENLLRSKEVAGSAVARLFADSCAAGVVFEDGDAIKEALATLGRNEEIEYAAVWGVDGAGKIGRGFGELRRGRPEILTDVPSATRLRRDSDRIVLASPARDQSGQIVAVAVVAFSLVHENSAIASIQRTTLWISSGLAIGLLALLMAMARLLIVGPLGKLVHAARELEAGGSGKVDVKVNSNDEVGQLAHAFRSMAAAIKVRETRIGTRNRDMRLVLDNVGQGFVTLDVDGMMSEERSRVIDDWFGAAAPGRVPFWDFLKPIDASVAQWFELGWISVRDDILPLALSLEQLPAIVLQDQRTFELAYKPIMEGVRLDQLIVVITDITVRIERERAQQAQREMMSIFRRTLADRTALDDFFADATALVEAITSAETADPTLLRRQVHTLKGNSALFGIESIAAFCHDLEDRMGQSDEHPSPERKKALRELWLKVVQLRAQLTGGNSDEGIQLDRGEYTTFIGDLNDRMAYDLLTATAVSWQFEPASKRLGVVGEQIRSLAKRLGTATVVVVCVPTRLRLPPRKWGPFWSIFAHVVRNTVDHGIEKTEERVALGKPRHATVTLSVVRDGQHVIVTIADDGRGIDWPTIDARAKEQGLPHATPAELEEALFKDGISSRRNVTNTSGRGVGLGAVRQLVRELGGHVEIRSEPGRGSAFRFVLPQDLLLDENPPSPAEPILLVSTPRLPGDPNAVTRSDA